jgi:cell wall-associated NlpC family hydrolase
MPASKSAGWASTPAGIDYAVRKMSESGARGLRGQQAVDTIVRNFERPARPDTEVAKSWSRYGSFGARSSNGRIPGSEPGDVGSTPTQAATSPQDGADFKRMLALTMLNPQQGSHLNLLDLAMARQQLGAAQEQNGSMEESAANRWGGTTQPPISSKTGGLPGTNSPVVNRILAVAHDQIGKPYVWGGESPKEGGFDCSGLIDFAYRQAGIKIPGRLTTNSALKLGKSVKGQQMRPGDMVVVNNAKHMVMYVGNGQVIAAPHKGAVVQYQPMSAFRGSVVDVRRII